jgi:ectoine hydroxylase-related dioxygenase (phytanoyl-CoA dioxygenase family)
VVETALISAEQRHTFETTGLLAVPDALSPEQMNRFSELHERIYAEERSAGRLASSASGSSRAGAMHTFGFVVRDPAYLDLLDLPSVFPLVCGLLGWNIHMYHCHIDQHPPVTGAVAPVWGWHQDGGRQNVEMDSEPTRPRMSIKVVYFLSDVSVPGRGNTLVLPGSHRLNRIPRPEPGVTHGEQPEGAVPLCVPPGTAVLFDRRLWHSRSDNTSSITRTALFLAYTYRWIRPRDTLPIDWTLEPYRSLSPIRKQLLGDGDDAPSFWGIGCDPPLKEWLRRRGLLDRTVPVLR